MLFLQGCTMEDIKDALPDLKISYEEKNLQDDLQTVPTSDEIKQLDGLPYSVLNGIKYLCHPKLYVTSESLAILRNLRLRDDDVWMVGYPKSGNHWALEVLTMIQNQNTEFAKRPFAAHCTDILGLGMQKLLDTYESPRILGTHLRYSKNYPKEVLERKLKIVYLIRNPKDVFVSAYSMWKAVSEKACPYTGTFNDFLSLEIKGEFLNGCWFDHVLTMEKFMAAHPEYPVHIHSYEKMKEDPVSAITELCVFLGKPTDLAADIARATEFGHMKKIVNTGKMAEFNNAFMKPSTGGMFRKGAIGDWRNMLTPEQSAQFDKVFNEKMADSKLADLVRKYL